MYSLIISIYIYMVGGIYLGVLSFHGGYKHSYLWYLKMKVASNNTELGF